MNVFNRLIVVLLLLLIIVLLLLIIATTVLILIVPQEILRQVSTMSDLLKLLSVNFANSKLPPLFAAGLVLGVGILILACLFLLWLELRQPRKKTVRVQKLTGGEAHITVNSIEQRLAYNIDQLPDVIKVSSRINSRARGVDIDLLLETAPDIDVPMKTEEVLEVTREVIVERLGLKLGKVQVQIKHAPYPKE